VPGTTVPPEVLRTDGLGWYCQLRKLELKSIKTLLVAVLAAAARDPRLGAARNLHALLLATAITALRIARRSRRSKLSRYQLWQIHLQRTKRHS
jgi:hypothetical protein